MIQYVEYVCINRCDMRLRSPNVIPYIHAAPHAAPTTQRSYAYRQWLIVCPARVKLHLFSESVDVAFGARLEVFA